MRVVEARRGALLPTEQGKRTDLEPFPRTEEVAPATANRYRQIARNWDWLWPEKVVACRIGKASPTTELEEAFPLWSLRGRD
jgi:hypothetical protein